jgi:hypothetical protein
VLSSPNATEEIGSLGLGRSYTPPGYRVVAFYIKKLNLVLFDFSEDILGLFKFEFAWLLARSKAPSEEVVIIKQSTNQPPPPQKK